MGLPPFEGRNPTGLLVEEGLLVSVPAPLVAGARLEDSMVTSGDSEVDDSLKVVDVVGRDSWRW